MAGETAPLQGLPATGKLRNGLFLRRVAFYPDRISVEIFSSRPFRSHELGGLRLTDDCGTAYRVEQPDEVIAARGCLDFKPGLPERAHSLRLGQPGWAFIIVSPVEPEGEPR